ncbi:helix-turn-helix domain-containing protein [bacterium]|nr:helix-turn-helix domain-containing protein [bacterium]
MSEVKELLKQHFPQLNDIEFVEAFEKVAEIRDIPAGTSLMDIGQYIKAIPLLVEGLIKVFREDEEGNELFLYYIYPGQACAISFVCSARERISQIRAEALDNCKVLSVPIECMDPWMTNYKVWYYYVLETYRTRFEEVLKTVDSIAFHRMDERLMEYLRKNVEAQGSEVLQSTHQDIAYELNTSREVISRLLKKLEQNGKIKLGRNQILVKDLN